MTNMSSSLRVESWVATRRQLVDTKAEKYKVFRSKQEVKNKQHNRLEHARLPIDVHDDGAATQSITRRGLKP